MYSDIDQKAQGHTVHGHLVDLRRVVLLDIAQNTHVVVAQEVDGNALSPEAAGATHAVNVELTIVGQIVVNHERHLLYVESARAHVGRDQHSATGSG